MPSQLQSLSRVPLLPNVGSQRGESMRMLDRIETIEVSEASGRDGRTVYVMDIYLCQATVLMPRQQPSVPNTNRKPDFRVARRYSEFIKLSKAIYNHTFGGHYWQRCLFCEHVIQSTASGPSLTTKLISSQETKLKHLTAFMQMLLRLALPTGVPSDWYQPCQGQLQIPSIVYKFIQPNQTDNASVW